MRSVVFGEDLIEPCKIVCVGRNYVEHIQELQNEIPEEPVYFIKPNSSIGEALYTKEGLHYEGEISFLIQSKRIAGVGFGVDLTLRDLQSRLKAKGLPWERAKAFKNSALFSDFVPIQEWKDLRLELVKNDRIVQSAKIDQMIYTPDFLLQDIDETFGLDDGDIIMSGTPKGVGAVETGDRLEGRIYKKSKLLVHKEWISMEAPPSSSA